MWQHELVHSTSSKLLNSPQFNNGNYTPCEMPSPITTRRQSKYDHWMVAYSLFDLRRNSREIQYNQLWRNKQIVNSCSRSRIAELYISEHIECKQVANEIAHYATILVSLSPTKGKQSSYHGNILLLRSAYFKIKPLWESFFAEITEDLGISSWEWVRN